MRFVSHPLAQTFIRIEAAVVRIKGIPLVARQWSSRRPVFYAVEQTIAGRVLANGWARGVGISHALTHGAPFPAASDGRLTSVGALSIDPFLRPVCYQNIPESLLAPELRGDGEPGLPKRVDGVLQGLPG
jgi:hypothetical protein